MGGRVKRQPRRQVVEIPAQRLAVEIVDFRPTRGFAEFVAGDIKERIALLNLIGPSTIVSTMRTYQRCPAANGLAPAGLGAEIGIGLLQLRNRGRRDRVAHTQAIAIGDLAVVVFGQRLEICAAAIHLLGNDPVIVIRLDFVRSTRRTEIGPARRPAVAGMALAP